MHVQVVTYALDGMEEREYLDLANNLAPSFSRIPGLQAKIWLEDSRLGRYGAVYFWEDQDSMDRFLRSDLFEGTNPDFVDVESEGFSIFENLTAMTQPGLEVVEGRRRLGASSRTAAAPTPAAAANGQRNAGETGPGPSRSSSTRAGADETSPKRAPRKSGG